MTTGIVFIARNRLDIYENAMAVPLLLPFQQTVIADLEVINKEEFEQQLVSFVQANKLTPAALTVILSQELFFIRSLSPEKIKQTAEIREFLDVVPFEQVATKLIQTKTGTKILATNEDLYATITSVFIKLGFTITCIAPANILDKPIHGLDVETSKYLHAKTDFLKQHAMIPLAGTYSSVPETEYRKESNLIKKRKLSTRGMILIGIFIILLAVLGYIVLVASK